MKALPLKWQNIRLNRIAPYIYPRYFRLQPSYTELVAGHHFYLDDKNCWCEVFYEKISDGFWMLAMEIRIKHNNHYILETKKGLRGYSSVNILSSSKKIGYFDGRDIDWANNYVFFSSPGTTSEIYLEKGTTLRCCKLIFANNYLERLANPSDDSDNIFRKFTRTLSHRSAIRAELFLQDRLFAILRFERKSYHYRASLFSMLFELTAFFLKLSISQNHSDNTSTEKNAYIMLKATKILEQHFPHKFPGVVALADGCGISVSKLKRDFKKAHGMTPLKYFRNLQMNYVSGMLSGSEKTVKQLSAELGFKKSSTFSAWYNKINDNNELNYDTGV